MEKLISAALREKEILIKEIYHRVKNNLQVIPSLLRLQSSSLKDENSRAALQESKNQVQVMALIHEKLYRSEKLDRIDFREYATTLVTDLFQTYRTSGEFGITQDIRIEEVPQDIDTAIPCGLILHERVSNALKYAFPHGQGVVSVMFEKRGDYCELRIADNGKGLPAGFDPDSASSLGLRLVKGLAENQLDGILSFENHGEHTDTHTFLLSPWVMYRKGSTACSSFLTIRLRYQNVIYRPSHAGRFGVVIDIPCSYYHLDLFIIPSQMVKRFLWSFFLKDLAHGMKSNIAFSCP